MTNPLHKNRRGFTLIEIMIVVAIIALLAAIALPNFLRARKRSQATRILEDLRMIDSAVAQYALEYHKVAGDPVSWEGVQQYLKKGSPLYNTGRDVLGHIHTFPVRVDGVLSTPVGTANSLVDIAPPEFWSPYTLVD